jgi:hypothetical protein
MEQRVEGAWVAKQTAKGTVVATAIKRLRKAGGGMGVTRDDGAEVYSDGQRFGDRVDFVNTLVGEGNPVAMAQTGVLGYLVYLMMGAETVTAPRRRTPTPSRRRHRLLVRRVEARRRDRDPAPALQRLPDAVPADRGLEREQGRQGDARLRLARPRRDRRLRPRSRRTTRPYRGSTPRARAAT